MAKQPEGWDFDFTKIMADFKMPDFKVPGFDAEAMMAAQRRNIEAITEANRVAAEGVQALARRQMEILRDTMADFAEVMQSAMKAGTPEDRLAEQATLAKTAFDKAVADMKELSELVAKSNAEAAEVVSRRISESLGELKTSLKKK